MLDRLANEFVDSGYDIAHIERLILSSDAYQRSSLPAGNNAGDKYGLARAVVRLLLAESLLDAVKNATDVDLKQRRDALHARRRSLERVVEMCTLNPARALGEEQRLGSLEPGRQADVTVLDIRDGDWTVFDTVGDSLQVSQAVVPVLTVKRGVVFEPEWGPRPWGWEPQPPRD